MTKTHKTLFVSDVHLDEKSPSITRQFLKMLEGCDADTTDALYILGDLFEAWIGDDDDSLFHRDIIKALSAATQKGLRIYFMFGNRDFLIGKRFLKETGCTLLADEEKILLYGKPILLMHGDTLCTNDIAYLKARKLGRNRFLQGLFLSLPLTLRRWFADKMRAKSTRHTQQITTEIMDVTLEEVNRVMEKHQVNHLIHGHTHRPNQHHFLLQGLPATRIVLSAWHGQGNILIWDETGQISVQPIL